MPKICIPVMGKNLEEITEHTKRAVSAQPDLLEWRADSYEKILEPGKAREALRQIREIAGQLPLLFTFRSAAEGGEKAITPETYTALCMEAAISGCADLIDIEAKMEGLDAADLIKNIHLENRLVIASRHYFHKTPEEDEMREIFKTLEHSGADILKLAVMPQTLQDVINLLDITQEMQTAASRPVITMSMGPLGAITRISGETFGSCITYASAGVTSAPGQLPAEEVRTIQKILHRSTTPSSKH